VRGRIASRTSLPFATGAGRDGTMPPFTERATVIRCVRASAPASVHANIRASSAHSDAAASRTREQPEPRGSVRVFSRIPDTHDSHTADSGYRGTGDGGIRHTPHAPLALGQWASAPRGAGTPESGVVTAGS